MIENLTDTQMQTENQLLEEKERYRIAVESSQDAFFTYKCREKLLEIVNSKGNAVYGTVESIRNSLIMTVSIQQIRQS